MTTQPTTVERPKLHRRYIGLTRHSDVWRYYDRQPADLIVAWLDLLHPENGWTDVDGNPIEWAER